MPPGQGDSGIRILPPAIYNRQSAPVFGEPSAPHTSNEPPAMQTSTFQEKWLPWLTFACVAAATVATLRLEGRSWWCACGVPSLWAGDPRSSHCSQHLVDPYTLTHVLHGAVLCGLLTLLTPRRSAGWSFSIAVALEGLWEIVENSEWVIHRYRTATFALGYEGDSVINSVGDIAACALGWIWARRLGWRWSIALCLATELFLLIWIRDNLLLNIVMLLAPIEAIKHWQSGQ